jgi:hypothetical protein
MKKIFLTVAVASIALVSCKKDRTCHCRVVQDNYDLAGNKTSTLIYEEDDKRTKVGYQNTFNTCIHKKTTGNYPSGQKMYDYDEYCEVK